MYWVAFKELRLSYHDPGILSKLVSLLWSLGFSFYVYSRSVYARILRVYGSGIL